MVFDPTPLSDYALAWASPCTGTYKGEVLTPRRGAPPRVLQTFRLQVPAMRLTHVTRAEPLDHEAAVLLDASPSAVRRPPRRRSQMRSQCSADSFLPPVSG